MARSLAAGMQTEVVAQELRPIILYEFAFDSGTLRFWTGIGDLSWNGYTWTGTGIVLGMAPVKETSGIRANGMTFTLNGMPASIVAVAMTENYQERLCSVWLGALDSSAAVVADPYKIFSGRMDVMTLSDDGVTADIVLTAENRLVDLDRPKLRRFSDQDQQTDYSGDLFFEFLPEQQDKEIVWGRATPA